ncbi:uncharacterized protein BJ171DRAFT_520230 [Polychytrium aggregatum]|uniref:uncharacterized protein n=1 Tax=Polychytrium aggregatum TaxID=110093 RepID=UPI0022FDBDD1|nr:uncharacterized protein BJ171DRAFT_520230 [Polychytrium aggregatum]KAI9197421.1 hypothetical protein BJ171DRAFT_520230 [Polychytrium aggregatum]
MRKSRKNDPRGVYPGAIHFENLPNEVLTRIFMFVPPRDLSNLCTLSKRLLPLIRPLAWHSLIYDDIEAMRSAAQNKSKKPVPASCLPFVREVMVIADRPYLPQSTVPPDGYNWHPERDKRNLEIILSRFVKLKYIQIDFGARGAPLTRISIPESSRHLQRISTLKEWYTLGGLVCWYEGSTASSSSIKLPALAGRDFPAENCPLAEYLQTSHRISQHGYSSHSKGPELPEDRCLAMCPCCQNLVEIIFPEKLLIPDTTMERIIGGLSALRSISLPEGCGQRTIDSLANIGSRLHWLSIHSLQVSAPMLSLALPNWTLLRALFLTPVCASDDVLITVSEHCPVLSDLRVSHSPAVTDVGLLALGKKCRYLGVLNIEGCAGISDEGIIKFTTYRHPSLRLLNLGYVTSGPLRGDALICAIAKNLPFLHELDFAMGSVTESGLKKAILGSDGKPGFQSLKILSLAYCLGVTGKEFLPLLAKHALNLEELLTYGSGVEDLYFHTYLPRFHQLASADLVYHSSSRLCRSLLFERVKRVPNHTTEWSLDDLGSWMFAAIQGCFSLKQISGAFREAILEELGLIDDSEEVFSSFDGPVDEVPIGYIRCYDRTLNWDLVVIRWAEEGHYYSVLFRETLEGSRFVKVAEMEKPPIAHFDTFRAWRPAALSEGCSTKELRQLARDFSLSPYSEGQSAYWSKGYVQRAMLESQKARIEIIRPATHDGETGETRHSATTDTEGDSDEWVDTDEDTSGHTYSIDENDDETDSSFLDDTVFPSYADDDDDLEDNMSSFDDSNASDIVSDDSLADIDDPLDPHNHFDDNFDGYIDGDNYGESTVIVEKVNALLAKHTNPDGSEMADPRHSSGDDEPWFMPPTQEHVNISFKEWKRIARRFVGLPYKPVV